MPYNGARKSETEKVWDRPIIGPKGTGRNAAYSAEKTIKDAVILVLSLDLVKSLNFEHTFQRWNFSSLSCNFLQSLIKFSIPTRSGKKRRIARATLHFFFASTILGPNAWHARNISSPQFLPNQSLFWNCSGETLLGKT